MSVLTLSMLSVFAAAGAALLQTQNANMKATENVMALQQSKYLAQAAWQEAHYFITRSNPDYVGTSPEQAVTAPDGTSMGTYDYTVSKNGSVYTVAATGYIPNKSALKKTTQTFTSSFTYTYSGGVGLMVLDAASSGAFNSSGNGKVKIYGGKVQVNSSHATALTASGNAKVEASEVSIRGNYSLTGSAEFVSPTSVKVGQAAFTDPYAAMAEPTSAGLVLRNAGTQSVGGNTTTTLQPGIYGGLNFSGNSNVTLTSGIYYLDGAGGFSVTGNAVVTGNNVLIVMAGTGSFSMSGNGQFTLTALGSGTYKGFTLWQLRAKTTAVNVSGNARTRVSGILYLPSATLSVAGNGSVPNVGSLDVVNKLAISGNGDISLNNF